MDSKRLLPRSGQTSIQRRNPKRIPLRARKSTEVACSQCQSKRVRCDGNRPACRPCSIKGRTCTYDVEAGLTRKEGLERKTEALQQDVASFQALYRCLQSQSESEASAVFQRIRNGASLDSILQQTQTGANRPFGVPCDKPTIDINASSEWSKQLNERNARFEDELLSAASSDLAIQALNEGVELFFLYLGNMFPIITREEVAEILRTFLEPPVKKSGEPQRQVENKKVACGELLAICAVAFRYHRKNLPNGEASLCTPFYESARNFLDYVMEKDPLRAMRMCCCFGIYNVVAKSSLAASQTDWGIFLGSSNGLGPGVKPLHLSEDYYMRYTKVFHALVTVRGWVTAVFGRHPSPQIASYIQEARRQIDNTSPLDSMGRHGVIDVLQRNMARLTVLKADILRTATHFRTLSPVTLVQMKDDLARWWNGLPMFMRLEAVVEQPELLSDERGVIFYIHLFYMSTIMLKARVVLAKQEAHNFAYDEVEIRSAVASGVDAARFSARILDLIRADRVMLKNCWMTMYQCYITGLILGYAILKNSLSQADSSLRRRDIAKANMCIEILGIYSSKDTIARSLLSRLRQVFAILEMHVEAPSYGIEKLESKNEAVEVDEAYLFSQNRGDEPVYDVLGDLLKMLCYPFDLHETESDSGEFPYPITAEAFVHADRNLARHIASPFSTGERFEPVDLFPPDTALSQKYECNNYKGGFAGHFVS